MELASLKKPDYSAEAEKICFELLSDRLKSGLWQ
jgi:hypothetical protein